jgi:hypothetical protein
MILVLKHVIHIIAPMLKVRIKSGLKLVETNKIRSEIKQQRAKSDNNSRLSSSMTADGAIGR